jgi:hypothetical protein
VPSLRGTVDQRADAAADVLDHGWIDLRHVGGRTWRRLAESLRVSNTVRTAEAAGKRHECGSG